MKKAIVLFSVSFILVVTTNLNAQVNSYTATTTNSIVSEQSSGKSLTAPNGVSMNIMSSFTQKFANASDVIWSKNANYTFVYFKEGSVPVRGTYNKKGKLEYTVRYFYGSQIPAHFRNNMTANGYNMQITNVTEVKTRYFTTSFVKMEDDNSFLTIRINADGSLSEYENFEKAK